jgi:hypothetical protein
MTVREMKIDVMWSVVAILQSIIGIVMLICLI